jgi:hypothetical protein
VLREQLTVPVAWAEARHLELAMEVLSRPDSRNHQALPFPPAHPLSALQVPKAMQISAKDSQLHLDRHLYLNQQAVSQAHPEVLVLEVLDHLEDKDKDKVDFHMLRGVPSLGTTEFLLALPRPSPPRLSRLRLLKHVHS